MISNGIRERQNSDMSLKMLAAQRRLYAEAKTLELRAFLSFVALPFVCAVVELLIQANANASTFSTLVLLLALLGWFVSPFVANVVRDKQVLAARIQLHFDLEVYKLTSEYDPFDDNTNINSDIAEKSAYVLSDENSKAMLLDWYPVEYDLLPLKDAISLCQQMNVDWDYNLRSKLKYCAVSFLSLLILFVAILGILKSESLDAFIRRLVFILPIGNWLLAMAVSISNDMRKLERLKSQFLTNHKYTDKEIIRIQGQIHRHREECVLIPDWVYFILRNSQINIFKATARIERERRDNT